MRTIILDSDKQNIEYLSDFIKDNYTQWIVNAYATPFALATAIYDDFKGDVELLMVHVEGDSSIELAKDLQAYFPHIRIIFYSGTTAWAEKIFQAVPIFFLSLPFQRDNLTMALERVSVACKMDIGRTLTIQFRSQKQKIRFSAIRYMESLGRKMLVYTDEGSFETYMTMEEALDKLPPQFIKCHRSYIVNADRIEKCSTDGVWLTGRTLVPISRSCQKKLRAILN